MNKSKRLTFQILEKRESDVIGEKALSLYHMAKKSIPIPQTLVIGTDAFSIFSRDIIKGADNGDADLSTASGIDRYCTHLSEAIKKKQIDGSLFDEIYGAVKREFGDAELIFRSSALGEDSRENSFAGQLDSIATDNAKSHREACRDALLKCWASFWGTRSVGYQLNRDALLGGMSVMVQPYINSALSGVLFTSHPVSAGLKDRGDAILLECIPGRGEELVSGKRDPHRFLLYPHEKDLEVLQIGPGGDGTSFLETWKPGIEALVKIARRIAHDTGRSQDIEWTIDISGQLYILQSRPVTTQALRNDRSVVWSNVNVNENFPEALTPFLMSFARKGYYHYFRNLAVLLGISPGIRERLEPDFANSIGFHRSRMYYNLTSIYRCLSAFPLPDLAKRYWDSFIGIYDLPYEDIPETLLPASKMLRCAYLGKILIRAFVLILHLPYYVRRFEDRIDRHIRMCSENQKQCTVRGHKKDIERFIDIRMHRWKDPSLADALAMFGYGLLQSCIGRYAPSRSGNIHLLLIGISDLASHGSQQALWEITQLIRGNPRLTGLFSGNAALEVLSALENDEGDIAFHAALKRYQDQWGYRISGELLLTKPGYDEVPEKLVELLKGYLNASLPSPEEQVRIQTARRREATQQVMKCMENSSGILKASFCKTITRLSIVLAQQGIKYRERVRLKQARLYNQCRRSLLGLGSLFKKDGLVKDREDALFLAFSEIKHLSSCHTPGITQELVRRRRARYEKDGKTTVPDAFCLPDGQDYSPEQQRPVWFEDDAEMSDSILTGYSACEGKVIGRVRILPDISSIGMIQRGDILVTRQTDPGWAPAFPLISGLILERGGMLSHGAIVAREYGIPTLVGVTDATTRLIDGQLVLLDADRSAIFSREAAS